MVIVLGSSVVDLSFYSDFLPSQGETLLGKFEQGLGGKGFNQAVAARKAGAEVCFYTGLGDDPFQAPFLKKLEQEKIQYKFFLSPKASCGAAAILIEKSGANKIVVDIGANAEIPSDFFLENHHHHLIDNDVLLMQLETNLEFLSKSIQYAKSKNKKIRAVLNPAPADKKAAELINLVDYITPNESEACLLFGDYFRTNESIDNFFCNQASLREKLIVTRGEHGVSFWENGKPHHIPAYAVTPIDTSGAGDAFNGGFSAGLSQGHSLRDSIKYGQAVAALSVQKKGTSASLPNQKEIEALFLKEI